MLMTLWREFYENPSNICSLYFHFCSVVVCDGDDDDDYDDNDNNEDDDDGDRQCHRLPICFFFWFVK